MNKYRIINKLGEGAFSSVILALDTAKNKTVAIKKMKKRHWKDSSALAEADALLKLQHINIISLIDSFREDYRSYLVFESMDCNLLEYLNEYYSLIPSNPKLYDYQLNLLTLDIGHQILSGLSYTHQIGFFHRDLKPENILVSKDIHGLIIVKIADFGLVHPIDLPYLYADIPPENPTPKNRRPLTTYVSTRWYRAPELAP
ncbi:hypothetical protein BB558_003702 [Smittium angustum]|uniref:Protein kinase domain-containing protein n=1 Tax=Smittium angustum TaxID=133377 RepID=A0A2U1J5A0_SMIAN|nr:hypothetical protein BB558_003702 [Smittium angustum]